MTGRPGRFGRLPAMNRLTVLLAFLAAFFAGGCMTDPVTGGLVLGLGMSEEEEREMGLAYKPLIVHEYSGPYPDAELQQHLASIVLPMAAQTVRPDLPWTFTVLNTSLPNAFAVPGGQVFVTRGILVKMEDEAEFAVVMGHELGHVEHRHSVQSMGRQSIFGGLASAVSIGLGSGWGDVAGSGLGILDLSFSRGQELESDIRGVESSYKAGYDPREGADVFRMFLAMKQEMGDETPWFLSTHPADEERIANILEMCAQKDPRLAGTAPVQGLRSTTPEWSRLIARLREEQKTYDKFDRAMGSISQSGGEAEGVRAALPALAECAQELPKHALLVGMLGQAKLVTGDSAGGRADLERASAMNQGILEPEWILGSIAMREKRWDVAQRHAERGLAILPGNYACLAVRGESRWNSGNRAAAEKDFEAVVQSAPEDSNEYRIASARLSGQEPDPPQRR